MVCDKFINAEIVIALLKSNLLPRRESKAVQKEYGLDTGANPQRSGFVQLTETMTNFNFISATKTCHLTDLMLRESQTNDARLRTRLD